MNIVLFEPEIPQNTGNIVRTCAATASTLHLIKPLGFSIEDKHLKRAGLDYWHLCDIKVYDNFRAFKEANKEGRLYYASTKAALRYDKIAFGPDDYIVFGPETRGLPEEMLFENYASSFRIPMIEGCRSLNLSNSVAVILFEALRQHDFAGLEETGHLTKY